MSKLEYKDLIAFHPGYYVKEIIEGQGMTQDELAKRLQTSGKYVSELLNGKINLTEEMILKLSTVFGTSTSLWLNLNKTYMKKRIEIDKQRQEDAECELARMIDYKFWVNLGLLPEARATKDKVRELQKYFRVASLSVLQQKDFLVQYRTAVSEIKDINVINANAWVQTAINIGVTKDVELFDKKKLLDSMEEIRSMTVQNPKDFYTRLEEVLAECGVALVLLPNLKNCGVNGAVKWLNKDKVILALNDRRKYADSFWFSLFHELGHVMQRRLKILLVSNSKESECFESDELIRRLEDEADAFSQNMLIPEKTYEKFVNDTSCFNEGEIRKFAQEIGIHPGIVLGRLQREHYIPYQTTLNSLKEKYIVV